MKRNDNHTSFPPLRLAFLAGLDFALAPRFFPLGLALALLLGLPFFTGETLPKLYKSQVLLFS